jgi:hypothetical protein
MVMKSMLGPVFASLLLGMTPAYAQSIDNPEAKPFHISSRGSAYEVQGEFEGTYRINDSSIEVYVSKATLYVSEDCPYQGRRRINYIKFGLWNQEASKWRVENSAPPLYLYVVMSPGEEASPVGSPFLVPEESYPRFSQALACGRNSGRPAGRPNRGWEEGVRIRS